MLDLGLFLAQTTSSSSDGASLVSILCSLCILGAFILIFIVGSWKIFTKAGQPGIYSIIPIFNTYILVTQIIGRDLIFFLIMLFIPPLQLIIPFDLAKVFGKDTTYGCLLLIFPPMYLVLAFSDAQYRGPLPK